MQGITLGQTGEFILWMVAIIGGLLVLYKYLKDAIKKILEKEFDSLKKDINDLKTQVTDSDAALGDKIDALEMQTCKNFIVRYLGDVERGAMIGEVEKERFAEEYDYYINHKGNSYIKSWYGRLKDKGYI